VGVTPDGRGPPAVFESWFCWALTGITIVAIEVSRRNMIAALSSKVRFFVFILKLFLMLIYFSSLDFCEQWVY
jgi:hypothetical protein